MVDFNFLKSEPSSAGSTRSPAPRPTQQTIPHPPQPPLQPKSSAPEAAAVPSPNGCNCDRVCNLENGLHPPLLSLKVWGRSLWNIIHVAAVTSNLKENQQQVKSFYMDILPVIIPCPKCKAHYLEHIQKSPLTDAILQSNGELLKWTVHVHNQVNQASGRQVLTVDQVMYQLQNPHVPTYNGTAGADGSVESYAGSSSSKPTWMHKLATLKPLFVLIVIVFSVWYYVVRPNQLKRRAAQNHDAATAAAAAAAVSQYLSVSGAPTSAPASAPTSAPAPAPKPVRPGTPRATPIPQSKK